MAYRESKPLAKLAVLALIAWGAWKYGVPWLEQHGFAGSPKRGAVDSPAVACVSAADDAVAWWSRGIVRFINPPVEEAAWSEFRTEVERKIDKVEATCRCPSESCTMAREIASDLRGMLSEMDEAARSGGSPPGDIVRAQESIDLKIEEAWKLADAGR